MEYLRGDSEWVRMAGCRRAVTDLCRLFPRSVIDSHPKSGYTGAAAVRMPTVACRKRGVIAEGQPREGSAMRWRIDNEVPDRVLTAHFVLAGVAIRPSLQGLRDEIARRVGDLRSSYSQPAQASGILAPSRRLYHALGIDPSRKRPSSEALVRRVIQEKDLYEVNTAVDAGNLTSMLHMRCVGLYDADNVRPHIVAGDSGEQVSRLVLRLGAGDEGYDGIRKDRIHLAGRPGLFDTEGPFGNPSADSSRTMVTVGTTRLLYVLFESADESDPAIREHLQLALDTMSRHVGGTVEDLAGP